MVCLFQPSWVRTKEFWDKTFEDRYERMRNDTNRPRLKVSKIKYSFQIVKIARNLHFVLGWANYLSNQSKKKHEKTEPSKLTWLVLACYSYTHFIPNLLFLLIVLFKLKSGTQSKFTNQRQYSTVQI